MRGVFSKLSVDYGIALAFNELTHGLKYIYFTELVGKQEMRVPAIKGKTPGSKPRDLSISWAFCLLRPLGVRVPVPCQLVRTPRVSGHVPAAPKYYSIYASSLLFSNPPRRRYSARESPS